MSEVPARPAGLLAAVDVHYLDETTSRAALVTARDQRFSVIAGCRTVVVPVADAARAVEHMAGEFRLPDALKLADRLARGLESQTDCAVIWFPPRCRPRLRRA